MSAGIPLTDADRAPWLDRLTGLDRPTCLASDQTGSPRLLRHLKEDYRRHLSAGRDEVLFVYLKADPALLAPTV